MAYIRFRRQRRVRAGAGYARVGGMRRRFGRGGMMAARSRLRYNTVPTFVETFKLDPITFNATAPGSTCGLIQNSLSQIPQVLQYTSLYNQYCIKKITAIFVPAYNVYDQPAVGSSVTQAPRFVYSIQNSAVVATPAVEADVLQDNGAKIRMFTKPIKVSWVPRPSVADAQVAGGFAGVNTRGSKWYTTSDTVVVHNGLSYSFQNEIPLTGNPPIAQVYIKMTFSLRDPK